MEQNKEKHYQKDIMIPLLLNYPRISKELKRKSLKKEGFEKVHQSVNPISQNYVG